MKFFFRIICIHIIFFCFLPGCSNDLEKKLKYYKKGNKYFQAEKYKEAEIEYKNAIQIDKNYTDAMIKLGHTLLKLG
ncbi:MAG: tetratricopeptide repeat protein, partial [Desulfobacteraceae bacterium]|nr:tetratricopeptide repeat protein [Desulfobacteraceae bacterium]